jgi:NADPH:quinone reductase-like Zn-dependent oxidoreductase
LDVAHLYTAGHRVIGVRTGNRASVQALWSAVAEGFRPVIDRAYPLSDAPEAHRYLQSGEEFGRVLLGVPQGAC